MMATAAETVPDSAFSSLAFPDPEWATTIPLSETSAILDPAVTWYSEYNGYGGSVAGI